MPEIVELQRADDPRDVIHLAVQRLVEGRVVGLPAENGYVLAALATQPAAVADLGRTLALHPSAERLAVLLRGPEEARDYAPALPAIGARLARRCWPGPVTLLAPANPGAGLLAALPSAVAHALAHDGWIALRHVQHDVPTAILRLLPAPLVVAPVTLRSGEPARNAADILAAGSQHLDFIVSDGPSRYAQPPTRIRVEGESAAVEVEGVVKASTVQRLSGHIFLFVCTGNTCRSPMAEALFRKHLADRLRCSEDQLIERGYVVASAGVAASLGAPASPEAVEVLAKRGVDLSSHSSQPLSRKLFAQVDRIWTLTRQHRDAILRECPEAASRVELLSRQGGDIPDPIGGGMDEYVDCANAIEKHVRALVAQILPAPP